MDLQKQKTNRRHNRFVNNFFNISIFVSIFLFISIIISNLYYPKFQYYIILLAILYSNISVIYWLYRKMHLR